LNGATTVIFEGPSYPDFSFEIIENIMLLNFIPLLTLELWQKKFRIRSKISLNVKVIGSVEPINEEAWHWLMTVEIKMSVVDTWWQTGTGGIMISPIHFETPTKPTYATLPLPGIQPVLMDELRNEIEGNQVSRVYVLNFHARNC
jgi:acetyl-CoA synthetase